MVAYDEVFCFTTGTSETRFAAKGSGVAPVYGHLPAYNTSLNVAIYHRNCFYALSPYLAARASGLPAGYQDVNSSMWYYSQFASALSHGNCSKMAYALTWINSNPESYWLPISGQVGMPGVNRMHADPLVAFVDAQKWIDISEETGYRHYSEK